MYKELDRLRYELNDGMGDSKHCVERTFDQNEYSFINRMFDYLDYDYEERRNDARIINSINLIFFIARNMKDIAEGESAGRPLRIDDERCCRSCHERIWVTDRYCSYCGAKIKW